MLLKLQINYNFSFNLKTKNIKLKWWRQKTNGTCKVQVIDEVIGIDGVLSAKYKGVVLDGAVVGELFGFVVLKDLLESTY